MDAIQFFMARNLGAEGINFRFNRIVIHMFYNLWILLLGSARNIWSIKHNHRKIRLSEKTIIKKNKKRKKKACVGYVNP